MSVDAEDLNTSNHLDVYRTLYSMKLKYAQFSIPQGLFHQDRPYAVPQKMIEIMWSVFSAKMELNWKEVIITNLEISYKPFYLAHFQVTHELRIKS